MTILFWLKSNWKLIAAAVVMGGLLFSGWYARGKYEEAKLAEALAEQNAQLAARYTSSLVRMRTANEAEVARAKALAQANAAMRERNDLLREEISNANLADTRTPAILEASGDYTCPTPLADMDFIRLWNAPPSGDNR